jgi:uncharacterized Zn-binding protein involved in type VI secretion
MALPAVQGDMVQGTPPMSGCLPGAHMLIGPLGAPMPNPPPGLPFVGMLNQGFVTTVTIGGKPVAVVGSKGDATVPHPGLHASDPAQANPMLQVGEVMSGSPNVTFGGKAAATSDSMVKTCGGTAKIQCLTATVTVN